MKLTSSEPFWLVKNGILHAYPSLASDKSVDVVIVGAGITGSLIAHQCIALGYNTLVLDRREVGNGSTSATTSMLQYEIDKPLCELVDLIGEAGAVAAYWACYKSIDTLGKIAKKVKSKCGFTKKESLYYAAYKKDIEDLKKEFETRKKHGFPVTWLEADIIESKYGIKNTQGGILSEQGGSTDAFQLAHDIFDYNVKLGLEIYDKTNIKKVTYKKGSVEVITEYGNHIKAKKIIYCNGFESTELIKDNFVNLISTFAIVSEPMKENLTALENTLVWNTAVPYMYLRTTDDGRLLVGGEDVSFSNAKERDQILTEKAKKIRNFVAKNMSDVPFRQDFAWAGTFGETKDGLPYIGTHPNFSSAYWVLGFGGNGITFSIIGMDLVSDYLKGKEHKLAPYFKFRR